MVYIVLLYIFFSKFIIILIILFLRNIIEHKLNEKNIFLVNADKKISHAFLILLRDAKPISLSLEG